MNNKFKRIFIGLVLPIVVTVLVCGIFYYKNAYTSWQKETQEYKEYQNLDGVTLSKGNWSEYFEYVEEYVMDKDSDGNVVNVRLDAYYKMKDKYYEKLDLTTESVTFIVNVDGDIKEYEISDPKTGEWNYTGKKPRLESDFYKTFLWYTSDNRDMCWWEPETNRGEIVESTTYYDMEKDRLILTIHEIEVLAVEGKLKFK